MSTSNTILLVEDDVSAAMPLMMGLQDEGFRALHARDGRQGLSYARAARPDLVLLDAMPGPMDGFTVCHKLRQESVVPIIMLGSHHQTRDRIKGLELGADDYVVRPYDFRFFGISHGRVHIWWCSD